MTKKTTNVEMNIIHKADYLATTRHLKKYRYKIWLKNRNFERIIYLNNKQLSKRNFEKLKIQQTMTLNIEKSFFGYTFNGLQYEIKD